MTKAAEIISAAPELFACWRGKRAAIPAPSYQFLTREGAIDGERRARGLETLEAFGVIPTVMGGVFEQSGRFAGTDERRAEDFAAALTLADADLVMPIRGGYGMTRLLPLLNWDAIGAAKAPACGFSDFTAFNLALWRMTGRASWQGPMLGDFAKPEGLDAYAMTRLCAAFGAPLDALGPVEWDVPEAMRPLLGGAEEAAAFEAEGVIWGGNLCLLESLLGTRWMPTREQTAGGILFLEDVGEAAYRVERMLLTLLDAGLLDGQKAILLGDFAQADDAWRFPGDATLAGAFSYIRSRLGRRIPLVAGLPFGHIRRKATLPVGLSGRFRISAGHAELVWRGRP